MKPDNPFINWVDVLIVVLLLLGIVRGRRRGISEELLDVIKWGVIVVACAFFYEPAGVFLAQNSVFSLLSCYVAMYAMIALLILLVFSFIRRSVGQKLVSSDAFGPTEYYLGMVAGMARYACVILVVMAILNARYFSPGEIGTQTKYQEDNFGTKLFPTLSGVQHETFAGSCLGRLTHEFLSPLLIRPTAPEDKKLGEGGSVVRARERAVKETLEKR